MGRDQDNLDEEVLRAEGWALFDLGRNSSVLVQSTLAERQEACVNSLFMLADSAPDLFQPFAPRLLGELCPVCLSEDLGMMSEDVQSVSIQTIVACLALADDTQVLPVCFALGGRSVRPH